MSEGCYGIMKLRKNIEVAEAAEKGGDSPMFVDGAASAPENPTRRRVVGLTNLLPSYQAHGG